MNLFNYCIFVLLLNTYSVISQVYLPQKSSVTFVIDDTGSMQEEIDQVKKGADAIFQTVYNSNSSQIDNFILVTFNDPTVEVRENTNVSDVFTNALSNITTHGGCDCPEMAMSGIEEALKVSKPGSSLYVFTDAAAKDHDKFETIKTISQKKQCQVVFVLTGKCGNSTDDDYRVYYKVAAATNGQVFNLQKDGVADILKYVQNSVVSTRMPVVAKVLDPGEHYISIPINAKTIDIMFSLSGEHASIQIYGPDGKQVNVENIVTKKEIKIVKPKFDLNPGIYTVKVYTSVVGSLMVTAKTTFEFQHGFSKFKPRTIDDTATLPASDFIADYLIDDKYYLSILPSRTTIDLESVDIVNNTDSSITIMNVPLHKHNNFYITDMFLLPNETFKIAVNAIDMNSKSPVRAIGITPIARQHPKVIIATPPAVRIEEGPVVEVEYGASKTTTLTCHATGYPEPTIQWKDEGNNIIESSPFGSTLHSNIYQLTNVLKINNILENIKYFCTSTNKEGTASRMVQVEIKPYILVVEHPKDANVKYGSSHTFMCRIKSEPASNISWYHNNHPIVNDKKFRMSLDNISLTITSMEPNHVGKITCEANNGVETKKYHSNVTISGVEAPKINKSTSIVKAVANTDIELQCKITEGVPAPSVSWSYRRAPEEEAAFLLADSDVLKIPKLKLLHEGQYICLASNKVGEDDTHVIEVIVEFAPIISEDEGGTVLKVKYNTSTTVSCNVTAKPAPTITWKDEAGNKLDTKVFPRDLKNEYISHLKINKVLRDSYYYCEAKNELGKDEYKKFVKLELYMDVLKRSNKTMSVQVGSNESLECEVDASPPPTIQWLHNGEIITKENNLYELSESNTLTIKNMGISHEGKYICEINGYKRLLLKTKVSIEGIVRPKIQEYTPPKAMINSPMTIHCKIVEGNPSPNITWWYQARGSHKYVEIANHKEDKLTLSNVDANNIGKYKCVADNLGGNDIFKVDVLVEFSPTIDHEPNLITVEEGKRVLLNCTTKGYPEPYVYWVRNDHVLSGRKYDTFINNSLAFYAKMGDSGTYTCTSTNGLGNATKTIDLKVMVAPAIDVPKKTSIEVMAGDPIMMTCQADGYPRPIITWTHRITERPHYSKNLKPDRSYDSSITIKSSVPEDSGMYTCEASNEYGSKALTYSVQVFSKPKIVSEKKASYTAVIGDKGLYIPCKAEGNPQPKITWSMNGFEIPSGTEWNDIYTDGTLVIKKCEDGDNGDYICTAFTNLGENIYSDTYNVQVLIEEYPQIIGPVRIVEVLKGDNVKLNCDASQSKIRDLHWFKDKKLFAEGELSIRKVTESDAGIYTCRSTNNDGTNTSSIDLQLGLDLRPKFLRTHYVDEYTFGRDGFAKFDCEVTYIDPNNKIIWMHNKVDLIYTKYEYNFKMYSDIHDIGNYSCVVSNNYGSIRRDFVINPKVCVATIPDLAQSPLILTSDWNWSNMKPINGTLTIPVGGSLQLSCPGIDNRFKLFKQNTIIAYCREGQYFHVEWNPELYTFADLQCARPLQATTVDTGVRCSASATNTTLVKIGFDTVEHGFLDVYNVCFDKTKNIPAHVSVKVFSDNEDVVPIESSWTKPELIQTDFDDIYNCAAQTDRISTTLEKDFHRDLCCFDKSMLVDPRDLEHRSAHISTYNYYNTAPQWSTCNKRKNWHEVEKRVRDLSRKLGHYLRVWTGTSQTLTLENSKFNEIEINLRDLPGHGITVPLYFWKVIQNPATKASLAIIQPNVPDLKAFKYLCKDICHEVDWMRGPDWDNTQLGFVYCCNIHEFEKGFKYTKLFDASGVVLTESLYHASI